LPNWLFLAIFCTLLSPAIISMLKLSGARQYGGGRGGGGGRGNYYKEKYGGGGRGGGGGSGEALDVDRDDAGSPPGSPPTRAASRTGTLAQLRGILHSLDDQSYGCYGDIVGEWASDDGLVTVVVDRVQRDPFAGPSNLRVRVSQTLAQLPPDLYNSPIRRVALCDYLNRQLYTFVRNRNYHVRKVWLLSGSPRSFFIPAYTRPKEGSWASEKGGDILILEPCQQVLETTAVVVTPSFVEAVRGSLSLCGRALM
jgi:hypothetical protein